MASRIGEIGTICRFCLCSDGLVAMAKVLNSTVTVEEIELFTGAKALANDDLPYAICDKCCKTIESSAMFRRTCLSNEIILKQLIHVLNASIRDNAARKEQLDAGNFEGFDNETKHIPVKLEKADSETEDTLLDYTDFAVEVLYDNTQDTKASEYDLDPEPNCDRGQETSIRLDFDGLKSEQSTSYDQADVDILGSSDSNDSMPLLYGDTPVNDFLNNEVFPKKEEVHSSINKNDLNPQQFEERRETETKRTEVKSSRSNVIVPADDGDSNDSLPSLYDEVMAVEGAKENAYAHCKFKYAERQLCPYCGLMLRFLTNHIKRTHIKNKRYSCPHCPVKMVDRFSIKEHINSVHEKRIIMTCEHCGKGFTNSNSHYYHLVNSHGKYDSYECETCHRKFKSHDGYKKHLKEHSLTSYPCPNCDKLFKTTVTLEKHQQRYHSSESNAS